MRKSLVLAVVAAVACGSASTVIRAEEPAAVPATQPAARDFQAVMADFQATARELGPVLSGPDDMLDASKRDAAAPKAIPVLKKMMGYAGELEAGGGMGATVGPQIRAQVETMLCLFGDAETTASIEKVAASSDKPKAVAAKCSLLMAKWVRTNKDATAQTALLDQFEALAKENPTDDSLANLASQMSVAGPASDAIRDRAEGIIVNTLSGPAAEGVKAQLLAEKKLAGMENKPLTIAGVLHSGESLSTDAWKGKVVLVDFWATWCGPCKAELPRVKKLYADYHAKGLEIVGVSCDESLEELQQFLTQNPDMPWPQMFDKNKPGWHALATEYGVQGIPTMFLIDKNGVVRTVKARENMDEMIPKLLAE